MLVKCYDDRKLQEWYTINKSGEVQTNNLMEWDSKTGFILKTPLTLYQRRTNANGTRLRVASVKEDRRLLLDGSNGRHVSMFGKMMIELASHLDFKLDFKYDDNYYGCYDKSRKKWSGLLGRLESDEIDVAVSEMSMTKERLAEFDFVSPIFLSSIKLYIKEPGGSNVQWSAYLMAFDKNIWISLIILIILSSVLVTYIKIKIKQIGYSKEQLVENHLYVWGIYCQQGLPEFPEPSSLRIAYVSIFLSATVLSAVYSAFIISYLTIFTPTLPFSNLAEYVEDSTYKLTVIVDSAEHDFFMNSNDSLLERTNRLMKPKEELPLSDIQAFRQVCQERVAYYSNSALQLIVEGEIPCKLSGIKMGTFDNVAFALAKDNPFTELLNYNILRFKSAGLMHRMKKLYLKKIVKKKNNYNAVGLWGITPLIAILLFGMFGSFMVLLIERLYHKVTCFEILKFP